MLRNTIYLNCISQSNVPLLPDLNHFNIMKISYYPYCAHGTNLKRIFNGKDYVNCCNWEKLNLKKEKKCLNVKC